MDWLWFLSNWMDFSSPLHLSLGSKAEDFGLILGMATFFWLWGVLGAFWLNVIFNRKLYKNSQMRNLLTCRGFWGNTWLNLWWFIDLLIKVRPEIYIKYFSFLLCRIWSGVSFLSWNLSCKQILNNFWIPQYQISFVL